MLWAAADSRVSSHDQRSSRKTIIDDAVKIMGLPLIARAPDPSGFFSEVYYAHTVGYAFAGSSLMGQNAYLALVPLLSNLISLERRPPALADVADYVARLLNRTFDETKHRGKESLFEVAIFGFCSCRQSLATYHFAPNASVETRGGMAIKMTPCENLKDQDFIYLGDNKASMRDAVEKAFKGPNVPGRPASRAPRYVIADCIEDVSCGSIGGDLQLAIADREGFRPLALLKPRVIGTPEAYLSYLGHELDQSMQQVGSLGIGVKGMA